MIIIIIIIICNIYVKRKRYVIVDSLNLGLWKDSNNKRKMLEYLCIEESGCLTRGNSFGFRMIGYFNSTPFVIR